jgi:hypothetical protein
MTAPTEVDHKAVGLALLTAAGLTVYDGKLPDSATDVAPPYVLVYTFAAWPDADGAQGLDGLSGTCVVTWYCHCVGGNDTAALVVAGRVRAALLDQRPTIAGRSVDMIRHMSSLLPDRDEALRRSVIDHVHVYQLQTRPG